MNCDIAKYFFYLSFFFKGIVKLPRKVIKNGWECESELSNEKLKALFESD